MESLHFQLWTRIGTMSHPRRVGRGVLTAPRPSVIVPQVRRRGEDTQPYLPVYGKPPPPTIGRALEP